MDLDDRGMKIGSLFSGIGGLELGLERAIPGASVAWQVEIDPWCRGVLARHWPSASREVCDVRHAGASSLERVDLICGGFPCQDVSSAGRQAGIVEGTRSGLWIEFSRVVAELRPDWVVIENVASGQIRWVPRVRHDLRSLGYDSVAVGVSAAEVGAPHRRKRVFVLAHRDEHGREGVAAGGQLAVGEQGRDADRRDPGRTATYGKPAYDVSAPGGRAAESRLGGGAHGIPSGLDRWPAERGLTQHAWEPPRTAPGKSSKHDRARLKALGNAVVPACAEVAGRVLLALAEVC